jgi:nucleoside-diphosphate-sugar epimerase
VVLVTGASGTVGYEVFKELLKRQDQYKIRLLCLDRKVERQLFSPFGNKIDFIWGDIGDFDVVKRATEEVDYIIHTAGIIPPLADEKPGLTRTVNIDGTQNIINAIVSVEKKPRIIFTSSISVYGDRLNNPEIIVEDTINPVVGDVYALSKVKAEEIIQTSGVSYSIFRLCGILTKSFKIQPLMFHMPLKTSLEWCHPEDVGFALVEALRHDTLSGRIFNLGGGKSCRILAEDFLKKMFKLWGLDSKVLPEYAFALRNFHSGYYMDGFKLNYILNFQRRSLQDYFELIKNTISPLQKGLIKFVPGSLIRRWLLKKSEPLRAIKENNEKLIDRFYGSREVFNNLILKGNL